jgi:hypothetical protein
MEMKFCGSPAGSAVAGAIAAAEDFTIVPDLPACKSDATE